MLALIKTSREDTLISDRKTSEQGKVIRDKEKLHIVIKESIFQKDTTIHNVHTPNNRVSKYVR